MNSEMTGAELMKKYDEQLKALTDDKNQLIYIPVENIYPHKDNPRKELGDLSELTESIKANGVMQNLTVVPWDFANIDATKEEIKRHKDDFTAVIGHRRLSAARAAGLSEVPCVIIDMPYPKQLSTMLLENIQRSDLTPYEQAKGFQLMIDFGETVDSIAEKTGFSKTTVRRRLKMTEFDEKVLKKVSSRQISFGDIDKLYEIKDVEKRNKVLSDIGTANFNNALKAELEKQKLGETCTRMKDAFKLAGLYEIPGADYTKHQYQYSITGDKDIEDEIARGKSRGAVGYYYSYRDTFYLMSKKGETPKVQKSEAELQREKTERERKQRYEELEAAFKRAYELRREFIDKYTFANARANISEIIAFLVCMGLNDEINYTLPREDLDKLVCGGESLGSSYEEIRDYIESVEAAKWLLAISWLLCDNEDLNCFDYYGRYEENENLNLIYEFLEDIGYEMSDDERGLIDGTHPIFKDHVTDGKSE